MTPAGAGGMSNALDASGGFSMQNPAMAVPGGQLMPTSMGAYHPAMFAGAGTMPPSGMVP